MAINANAGEYLSRVGLADLYVAEVTQDDASGFVCGTPEALAPAAEASVEPASNSEVQYADDAPYYVFSSEGETKVTLTVTGVPAEMLAKLTGKYFHSASGRVYDYNATKPYFALGFRSKKADGSYRYYWFLKGTFGSPKESLSTLKDKPEPKPQELEYTAIETMFKFTMPDSSTKRLKRVFGDTSTTGFDATAWFSQVQTPSTSAPSALALSSSTPADNATGVSVSADITLTFNNALVNGATANVALIKASDASVFTIVKSLDTTKKIMTVNPTGSLSASTEYYVLITGVTDIYGQQLTSVVSFTTA